MDFYPDDFIGGTVHMDAIEVGMYVRCLCYLWGVAKLPFATDKLMRITGVWGDEFMSHWPVVESKFVKIEGEGYVHERLQVEREKKVAITEARREAGRKGGRSKARNLSQAKTKQREVGSMDTNSKKKKESIPPTIDQVRELATSLESRTQPEAFIDHYEANGWMVGKNQKMKSWTATFRKWHREGWGTANGVTGGGF